MVGVYDDTEAHIEGIMRPGIIALLFGVGLGAAACSRGNFDGTWVVIEMAHPAGSISVPDPVDALTLIIDGDNIVGDSGCNAFTGQGDWPGVDSNITVTARACADNLLVDQESLYLRNLMATATADVDGDTLTARDVDGKVVLVFERDPG
ncbi:MAG: META domain-containing protein [Acidimicrobiia bacterium]